MVTRSTRADVASDVRTARPAVVALMCGLFLAALDQTLFATTLPSMAGDLGAGSELFWIATATVLAGTVVMPVLGRLGDDLGRPRVFVGALALLLLGSVVGGLAQNLSTLLAARVLQGLGGGGLLVLVEAMVADLVPARRRTSLLSVVGSVFALAGVLGPVLGGLLAQTVGWRWAFWLNVPVAAVALVTAQVLLPRVLTSRPEPERRTAHSLRAVPALAMALVGLTMLASWSGPDGRLTGWAAGGVLVATVAACAAFVRLDRRSARPLVPWELFGVRNYAVAVASSFVLAVALFGTVAYLPTVLQMGVGLSPSAAGLLMLALVAGLGSATVLAARVVARTGRYRALPAVGALVGAFALALLATTAEPHTGLPALAGALALLGVGIGCAWEVLVVVAQNVAPSEQIGVATAGNGFVREVGVLLGTAGIGAAYAASVGAALATAPEVGGSAWSSLSPDRVAQLPVPVAELVRAAYTDALGPILWSLAPAVAGVAVLVAVLRPVPLASTSKDSAP